MPVTDNVQLMGVFETYCLLVWGSWASPFWEAGWQSPSSSCCVEEGFEKLSKAVGPWSFRVSTCLGLVLLIKSPGLLFNLVSMVGDRTSFFHYVLTADGFLCSFGYFQMFTNVLCVAFLIAGLPLAVRVTTAYFP